MTDPIHATAAALTPGFDPLQRLSSGLSAGEAVRRAQVWWDATGRHLIRNPAFRDPDLGLPSGILRGLAWEELGREEKLKVVRAWHGGRVWRRKRASPAARAPNGSHAPRKSLGSHAPRKSLGSHALRAGNGAHAPRVAIGANAPDVER